MSTGALDPLIHDPERLRIVAALAALPDGDALTVTRLQDRPPWPSPAWAGTRWITTPPCCGTCPRHRDRIIGHQHQTPALAMLTGTRQPRPWASTSREAG